MKTTKTIVLLSLSVLFTASCTVEKRLYNKGFHVEWKKNYKKDKGEDEVKEKHYAQSNETFLQNEINTLSQSQETASVSDELQTGDHERTVLTFNNAIPSESLSTNSAPIVNVVDEVEETKKEKKEKKAQQTQGENTGSSGKSQLVALLLVIFVGVLGIHRFYLGHIGIGILMLLTGGVFGILALIDLIRIITGDLKPKDGEYTETL